MTIAALDKDDGEEIDDDLVERYKVKRKRKVEYKQLFFCRACFEAKESFSNCYFHARNALTSHLIAKSNGCPNWAGTARSKEGIQKQDVLIYNLPYTFELEREDPTDVFSEYRFPEKQFSSTKFKNMVTDIREELEKLLSDGKYSNEIIIDTELTNKKIKK